MKNGGRAPSDSLFAENQTVLFPAPQVMFWLQYTPRGYTIADTGQTKETGGGYFGKTDYRREHGASARSGTGYAGDPGLLRA